MKLFLIGAASAAVLAVTGPAAAQYPPPPPPPSDSDQYGPQQDPGDEQMAPDDQDQAGPDDQDQAGPDDQDQPGQDRQYDDQAAPPPPAHRDQGRYAPPPQDRYPPSPGEQGPPPAYDAGPDYEPADVLVQREDMLEQRIQRMARRGKLDPRAADNALGELRAIQDEQDQMAQANRGLSAADQSRLSTRLDDLQRRVKSSKRR